MAEELKPCPTCGSTRGLYVLYDENELEWFVFCDMCKTSLYSEMNDTREDAIEAWNRRAERTCRPEVCDDGAGAWGVYCSECGYRFAGPHGNREVPEHMATRRDIMPRYCPSCGARVTEVVRDGD